MNHIDDVVWGDVVSDDDGVLVIRGHLDGTEVVVKRFASPLHRREIAAYALLRDLDVPALSLLGSGDDWLILEDLTSAGYRRATAADLDDGFTVRLVAQWYATLHAAGSTLNAEAPDYSEFDLIDESGLNQILDRWPDLAGMTDWVRDRLPSWADRYRALPHTLTHNDFFWTNLAIAWDSSSALMFDYNLLGTGLRESDVRNVTSALSPTMAEEFLQEYWRLAAEQGFTPSAEAIELDGATSHLVALIMAGGHDVTPAWAEASLAWARALTLD